MPQKTNRPPASDNKINNEIERVNHKLATLELEKKALIEKRDALLQQSSGSQVTIKLSANQKVTLFQKLFKGRSDVFANRWENTKGRSGYSVACDNEWVKGLSSSQLDKLLKQLSISSSNAANLKVIDDSFPGNKAVQASMY